jgi:hypothetical protein
MVSKYTDIDTSGPAGNGEVVDISSTDHTFSRPTRGIYVGTAGDLKVRFYRNAASVTLTALPAGLYPFQCDKVIKTGTTAAAIVGVW